MIQEKYVPITSTGKRKTAVAALIYDKNEKIKDFTINNRKWTDYFTQPRHQAKVTAPFQLTESQMLNMRFKVIGGGMTAQAEAVRHAISKLLKLLNAENLDLIKKLKQNGYLTRNAKKKEREKPGQRGARAQFNSSKR